MLQDWPDDKAALASFGRPRWFMTTSEAAVAASSSETSADTAVAASSSEMVDVVAPLQRYAPSPCCKRPFSLLDERVCSRCRCLTSYKGIIASAPYKACVLRLVATKNLVARAVEDSAQCKACLDRTTKLLERSKRAGVTWAPPLGATKAVATHDPEGVCSGKGVHFCRFAASCLTRLTVPFKLPCPLLRSQPCTSLARLPTP